MQNNAKKTEKKSNEIMEAMNQRLLEIDAKLNRDKIINEEKIKHLEKKISESK